MKNVILSMLRGMQKRAEVEWPYVWECPYCEYFKLRGDNESTMNAIIEGHLLAFHPKGK